MVCTSWYKASFTEHYVCGVPPIINISVVCSFLIVSWITLHITGNLFPCLWTPGYFLFFTIMNKLVRTSLLLAGYSFTLGCLRNLKIRMLKIELTQVFSFSTSPQFSELYHYSQCCPGRNLGCHPWLLTVPDLSCIAHTKCCQCCLHIYSLCHRP